MLHKSVGKTSRLSGGTLATYKTACGVEVNGWEIAQVDRDLTCDGCKAAAVEEALTPPDPFAPAIGDDLDRIAADRGFSRLPNEPDAAFRKRMMAEMRGLRP